MGTWSNPGNSSVGTPPQGNASQTLDVTAGDLLISFWTSKGGVSTGPTSIQDDHSNTWTTVASVISNRPSYQQIAWAVASSTVSQLAISATGGNTDADYHWVARFTHSDGAMTGATDGTGSNTSGQSCTVVTSINGDLIVAFGDSSGSISAGTGFTIIDSFTNANTVRVGAEWDNNNGNTAGSQTVALVEGTQRSIVAVAFRPPVTGIPNKIKFIGQAINRASTY